MSDKNLDYSYEELSKQNDLQNKINQIFSNDNLTADELFSLRESLEAEKRSSKLSEAKRKITEKSAEYLNKTLIKFTDAMLCGAGILVTDINRNIQFLKSSGYKTDGLLESYNKLGNKTDAIFVLANGKIAIRESKVFSFYRSNDLDIVNSENIKVKFKENTSKSKERTTSKKATKKLSHKDELELLKGKSIQKIINSESVDYIYQLNLKNGKILNGIRKNKDGIIIGEYKNGVYGEISKEKKEKKPKGQGETVGVDMKIKKHKAKKHEKRIKISSESIDEGNAVVSITSGNLNIRDENGKIIGKAKKGQEIVLSGDSKTICKKEYLGILLEDGSTGYVAKHLIVVGNKKEILAKEIVIEKPEVNQPEIITKTPTVSTDKIGYSEKLEKGEKVEVAKYRSTKTDDKNYSYEDVNQNNNSGIKFVEDKNTGLFKKTEVYENTFELYKKDGRYILEMNGSGTFKDDEKIFESIPSQTEINKGIQELMEKNTNKYFNEKIEII